MDDTQPATPLITADDPRVAQVLAALRARQNSTPNYPDPSTLGPTVATPAPLPTIATPGTGMVAPVDAPQAPTSSMAEPQPQPGPVKSFLQQLVSGLGGAAYQGTQGALQRLGIPTDYEKQQNAAKLAIQQQNADALTGLRSSQTDLTNARVAPLEAGQTPLAIPQDAKYGEFAGMSLPTAVATPIMQRMEALQNAKDIAAGKNQTAKDVAATHYGPDSYLRKGVRSVGGRIELYDKATGEKLQDMGEDSATQRVPMAANARARAMAMYRTFDTTDANGAPVTISGLDALQGGAAHVPYTQAKGILSDRVGVQQYQDILDNKIAPNLAVLNDNGQRIAIAHTLSELDKNPGAVQALITSALQNGSLSPAGAQLTAGIMQAREFGGVARKYGGNMNGTEGLMGRIIANQASPLNSMQLNQDLVANDRAFTQRALTNIGILQGHVAQGKTGPPNTAPTSAPADNGGHPSFFHPLTQ